MDVDSFAKLSVMLLAYLLHFVFVALLRTAFILIHKLFVSELFFFVCLETGSFPPGYKI